MPILEKQEFENTPGLEKRKIRKKKENNGNTSKWYDGAKGWQDHQLKCPSWALSTAPSPPSGRQQHSKWREL